jgi:four helix bundle protein
MSAPPYEQLEAWKVAHELALAVYQATRAAPANIAEGCARRGAREFRRHLDIARSSLTELGYLMRFARDAGVLPRSQFDELINHINRAGFLTWRLYRSLPTR